MLSNGVAEQLSKIRDVGILLDRRNFHQRIHAGLLLSEACAGRPCSEFGSHS